MNRIKKYLLDDNDSTAKAALFYMLCTFFTKAIAFISTPIFTRLLSKSDFGTVTNFYAWVAILTPIITLDLRITINRSKYTFREDNETYLKTILLTSNIVILLCWFIVELNSAAFINIFSLDMKYIRVLFLYLLFNCAFDYQQIQYQIYKKYKIYVFYTIISAFFSMLFSVLLVLCIEDKLAGRIYGMMIPIIIVDIIIYCSIVKKGKRFNAAYAKYAICMAVPLIPKTLSSTLLNASDKIIITQFCGSVDTALYSLAYSVAAIAAVVWGGLNQAWAPWLLDSLDKKNFEGIKSISKKMIIAYSGLIVLLMLFAPEIVLIMGGSQYSEAIAVMPPVILAMMVNFLCAFNFDVAYFYGETYRISIGAILAALINVVLNYMFIPKFGYIAAAYTTLVGYLFLYCYDVWLVRVKMKKAFVFDNLFFCELLVAIGIIQVFVGFLYSFTVLRIVVIGLYAIALIIVLYMNKDMVTKLIKEKLLKKAK